jgi:hypothetical protein
MPAFTWSQVLAYRLHGQQLAQRTNRAAMIEVVRRVNGLQAQVMSSAVLQLWARVDDLAPDDVENALWRDRKLFKTWAMRGTLHLLPADEFGLYASALSTFKHFRRGSWLKYHGVTEAELDTMLEGVRAALSDKAITREQLADALAAHTGQPALREKLLSGWGALLKPAAFQGSLCFGANVGQNVTFVRPDQWLGAWQPRDPQAAMQEMLRRYLAAYGPATPDDFARWWGFDTADARRVFRALGDALSEVTVDGWKTWALTEALPQIEAAVIKDNVRLLPGFDPYVLAATRDQDAILPAAYKGRVYRPQGWISPVVLVDGVMAGVWEHEQKKGRVAITVKPFAALSDTVKQTVEVEAARLAAFLGGVAEVVYSA